MARCWEVSGKCQIWGGWGAQIGGAAEICADRGSECLTRACLPTPDGQTTGFRSALAMAMAVMAVMTV